MTRRRSMKPTLPLGLALLAILTGPADAQDVDRAEQTRAKPATIVDSAKMFDPASTERAARVLGEVAAKTGVPTLIETVPDLRGETIEEASLKRAMQSGREGLFVLLAKDQRKIEVRVSRRYKGAVSEADARTIRDAFVTNLRGPEPSRAIEAGARAIADVLASAQTGGALPRPVLAAAADSGRSLIVRNQARLTLAGARAIIEGAEARAVEMGLKVNIAVVDEGGHPLAFARMDGARPASAYTANTKAVTAATFRQESGPLPKGAANPDLLLNLSLQNASAASGGKLTTLHGGVPVIVDDQVIGGVGVGGGTGEQDATIARAGVESFTRQLGEAPAARPAPSR